MKIKPLVWERKQRFEGWVYTAKTILGLYTIYGNEGGSWYWENARGGHSQAMKPSYLANVEEAKRSVFLHYSEKLFTAFDDPMPSS